ncbi:hypothetical protein K1719_026687 [Acacia pycnantha]|nr:hypothetical protein K1719_026687 [Acacia pycnantha]
MSNYSFFSSRGNQKASANLVFSHEGQLVCSLWADKKDGFTVMLPPSVNCKILFSEAPRKLSSPISLGRNWNEKLKRINDCQVPE